VRSRSITWPTVAIEDRTSVASAGKTANTIKRYVEAGGRVEP
jgi:hypothetical protein